MNLVKLFLFTFGIIELINISCKRTKSLSKNNKSVLENNLTKELKSIDENILKSEKGDICKLLNEQGFMKSK